MLKWLARPRTPPELVTDDPLATIAPDAQPHVYAVSRINPLFIEEDSGTDDSLKVRRKLTSSGYGSKLSSSERSKSIEPSSEDRESRDSSRAAVIPLSQPASLQQLQQFHQQLQQQQQQQQQSPITVIEQNPAFVKSIQVSFKGVCSKKHCPLSTIPEGKIDYCIPRPVWPRYESRQRKPPSVYADESVYWSSTTTNHESGRYGIGIPDLRKSRMFDPREQRSACDILKDISNTINRAEEASPEEVLRVLKRTINKSLEQLSSETALRKLSESMRESDTVITMNRALSQSSSVSVNDWCFSRSIDETESGRLLLLKRLGKFPPPYDPSSSYDPLRHSSSSSTSSGFSDLTLSSPQSSSSSAESPTSRRFAPNPPVFVHDNLAQVPKALRNAVLYGSVQCRSGVTVDYEKLQVPDVSSGSSGESSAQEDSLESPKSKTEILNYGYRGPDFTLDVHQAEQLMLRIKANKKRRCWCRFIVSLLGLAFLLFSVMSFSMMLTKGQRLFGSL